MEMKYFKNAQINKVSSLSSKSFSARKIECILKEKRDIGWI